MPEKGHNAGQIAGRRSFVLGCAALLAATLAVLFFRLDGALLFRDEASTMSMGRMAMKDPHLAPRLFDGRQLVVQAPDGHDLTDNLLPAMQGWLQFYVAAAALSVLPHTTFHARLPFVVLGGLSVWMLFLIGRQLWGANWRALLPPFFAITSVFFAVSIRQARYYPLVLLFSSWLLLEFVRYLHNPELAGCRRFYLRLAVPATLLYFSQYLSFGTMWLSLYVFALYTRDPRLIRGMTILSAALAAVLGIEFVLLHGGFVASSPVTRATDWGLLASVWKRQSWILWGLLAPASITAAQVMRLSLCQQPDNRRLCRVLVLSLLVIVVSYGVTLLALRTAALSRYYLQVLPALYVAQAVLLILLERAGKRAWALAAAAVMVIWPVLSWPAAPDSSEGVVIRQFKKDASFDAPLVDYLAARVSPEETVAFHRNPIGMTVHFYLPGLRWVGQLDAAHPDTRRFRGILPDFTFNDYPHIDWYVVWDAEESFASRLEPDYRLEAELRNRFPQASFRIYRRLRTAPAPGAGQ